MSTVLTTKQLMGMTPVGIKRAAAKCLSAAPRVNRAARLQRLRAEIRGFESRYKMTTNEMIERVCSGKLTEAGPIETWLHKYNLLCVHEKAQQA